jgi:hypothetical protein
VKILVAFLLGALFATAMIRPFVHYHKTELNVPADTIVKVAYSYERQAKQQPGQFDPKTMRMLLGLMQIDTSRPYQLPDSSNTRIFWLDAWPVNEETILLETYAGNAGGSCGATIEVFRYSSENHAWEQMLSECGAVDTVLTVSHNGLYDFVIRDKWAQDHWAYRFNGQEIVEADFYFPLSDLELVAIDFDYGKFYIESGDIKISYMRLGKDSLPYMIVQTALSEKYLYRKDEYNRPIRVNYFENAYQIDFVEEHHNGMPDVRTFDAVCNCTCYQWDGAAYVAIRTERWVGPA